MNGRFVKLSGPQGKIRAGVGVHGYSVRNDGAILHYTGTMRDLVGVTDGGGAHVVFAGERHFYTSPGLQCQHGYPRLDQQIVFSAEASADPLWSGDTQLAHGHFQDLSQWSDKVKNTGVGGNDVQAAVCAGDSQRDAGLDGSVIHLLRFICLLYDHVGLAHGGLYVAGIHIHCSAEIIRIVASGRWSVRRQCFLYAFYGGQLLVCNMDPFCGVLGLLSRFGGHYGDAVAVI